MLHYHNALLCYGFTRHLSFHFLNAGGKSLEDPTHFGTGSSCNLVYFVFHRSGLDARVIHTVSARVYHGVDCMLMICTRRESA